MPARRDRYGRAMRPVVDADTGNTVWLPAQRTERQWARDRGLSLRRGGTTLTAAQRHDWLSIRSTGYTRSQIRTLHKMAVRSFERKTGAEPTQADVWDEVTDIKVIRYSGDTLRYEASLPPQYIVHGRIRRETNMFWYH